MIQLKIASTPKCSTKISHLSLLGLNVIENKHLASGQSRRVNRRMIPITTPVGRVMARNHRASGRESKVVMTTPRAKTSPMAPSTGILCMVIPGCMAPFLIAGSVSPPGRVSQAAFSQTAQLPTRGCCRRSAGFQPALGRQVRPVDSDGVHRTPEIGDGGATFLHRAAT